VIVLDASERAAHVRALAAALGDAVTAIAGPGGLRWEQAGLPLALFRRGASLVHGPSASVPVRRPCPAVVTIRDLGFEAVPAAVGPLALRRLRWSASRAARSAERVIVPTPFTGREVIERYGVRPSKVRIVPEAPVGVAAGTGAAAGDHVVAVSADGGEIAAAAERLGLRLVVGALAGAAAFVHAPLYDGAGAAILEAMARGVPVVALDAGAAPEVAGGAAELFPARDPEAIAAALDRALGRREELVRLGAERVATLTWERSARLTRRVYAELA
jgi:glycosyltransferase involved in cell wall biosynthesis